VGAAAHEQIPDHFARNRIVNYFVDANLVRTRAAFEEEVMEEIELQIAAGWLGAGSSIASRSIRKIMSGSLMQVLQR
jgi:hypothetical protein